MTGLRPAQIEWRRPRHETVLLVLVALGALLVVHPPGAQDTSRICVTRSIVHGSLSATSCLAGNGDRAEFGGRFYTDKAPGVSFLAIPAAQIVRLGPPPWHHDGDLRLWAVRWRPGGSRCSCAHCCSAAWPKESRRAGAARRS